MATISVLRTFPKTRKITFLRGFHAFFTTFFVASVVWGRGVARGGCVPQREVESR